jgi:hypothetical protein
MQPKRRSEDTASAPRSSAPFAVRVGEHPLGGVAVVGRIAVAVAVGGGRARKDLERAIAAVGDLGREARSSVVSP